MRGVVAAVRGVGAHGGVAARHLVVAQRTAVDAVALEGGGQPFQVVRVLEPGHQAGLRSLQESKLVWKGTMGSMGLYGGGGGGKVVINMVKCIFKFWVLNLQLGSSLQSLLRIL